MRRRLQLWGLQKGSTGFVGGGQTYRHRPVLPKKDSFQMIKLHLEVSSNSGKYKTCLSLTAFLSLEIIVETKRHFLFVCDQLVSLESTMKYNKIKA